MLTLVGALFGSAPPPDGRDNEYATGDRDRKPAALGHLVQVGGQVGAINEAKDKEESERQEDVDIIDHDEGDGDQDGCQEHQRRHRHAICIAKHLHGGGNQ